MTDLQAAIDKLKADPDLHQYLAMAKHFGCTVEKAKFRYANEKAFRETVLLLAAEAEIYKEKVLEANHRDNPRERADRWACDAAQSLRRSTP